MYDLRPAKPGDAGLLATPIKGCGLFSEDEAQGFISQTPDLLADPDQFWWVLLHGDWAVGAAYLSLEGLSADVWHLWFIGLVPAHQGQGGGQMLLKTAEAHARSATGRLMLIDTSSDAAFAKARRFYEAAGYQAEARIRDYYADGQDKITLRKRL